MEISSLIKFIQKHRGSKWGQKQQEDWRAIDKDDFLDRKSKEETLTWINKLIICQK